jgi:2-oxoglutarate dehydrogenase E1 component
MDKYSFLNAVHPTIIAELYDKYLNTPDEVEPSWRSFFQGFDFGVENGSSESLGLAQDEELICANVYKEFQVIKLIDAYRTRGHLFTKTNPVRNRRTYSPTLDLENFGLSTSDLKTVFKAGEIVGIGEASLEDIIKNLHSIYCNSIGVEYMYIRQPEERKWIQEKLHVNSNQPNYSLDQKKFILKKLNDAVSFESFLHTKYVGQKRFSLEGGESLIPALDILIKTAANKGVKEFVMGMAHR